MILDNQDEKCLDVVELGIDTDFNVNRLQSFLLDWTVSKILIAQVILDEVIEN